MSSEEPANISAIIFQKLKSKRDKKEEERRKKEHGDTVAVEGECPPGDT